jgi:hypothetical protein
MSVISSFFFFCIVFHVVCLALRVDRRVSGVLLFCHVVGRMNLFFFPRLFLLFFCLFSRMCTAVFVLPGWVSRSRRLVLMIFFFLLSRVFFYFFLFCFCFF